MDTFQIVAWEIHSLRSIINDDSICRRFLPPLRCGTNDGSACRGFLPPLRCGRNDGCFRFVGGGGESGGFAAAFTSPISPELRGHSDRNAVEGGIPCKSNRHW